MCNAIGMTSRCLIASARSKERAANADQLLPNSNERSNAAASDPRSLNSYWPAFARTTRLSPVAGTPATSLRRSASKWLAGLAVPSANPSDGTVTVYLGRESQWRPLPAYVLMRVPPDSVVCEEGHLLQGYVQESNETHEVSQHVTQSRRLRKRRIKKYRPPSNAQFHGERGTFLLFQALQWILREQVRVMIDELGFPPELEGVTRDLWGLYLASSGVPNAPADYLAGNEPASSYCGPRAGARYTVKGRPSKAAKREGTADAGDEGDGSDVDGEMTDADRTAGSGSDADDSDTDASDDVDVVPVSSPQPDATSPTASSKIKTAQGIKAPPKKQRKTSFGYNAREQPRMDTLLVILYLACCTLRFPVFTKDVLQSAPSLRQPNCPAPDTARLQPCRDASNSLPQCSAPSADGSAAASQRRASPPA